jgi:putative selenate reductase molybdopterin-binding subunit
VNLNTVREVKQPRSANIPAGADTYDKIGPLGAKVQGECATNCVAPAIVNAVADAAGVRFTSMPLLPERIFDRLGS